MLVPHVGFLLPGHDVERADALRLAANALMEAGMTHADAEAVTVDRPSLVTRAWWGGEEVGFINHDDERHDGQPVTVVNIPAGEGL